MNTESFTKSIIQTIKNYIEKKFSHLEQRVDEAIKSIPEPVNGKDGTSVTLEDVRPLVEELVKSVEVPLPDISHLEQRVDEAIKSIPEPVNGKDGRDGEDGRDGRDSLDLEILPDINFSKTYPAGVYAYHEGGLWRTANRTNEKSGWECIVDGVSDVDVDFDGERKFTIRISKSSGKTVEKTFRTPNMIDRGVYTESKTYETSDCVTYGGSLWVAQTDNPEGKPGVSKDWRLSVKKGRDGRESVKIERSIDKVKV